ncbi:hypothetical protein QUB05_13675 [Microcoleus sp. F10-C6]|uniref:hypothetical protein n=1 Tax=unclassified Microcoleus TaxID=2642155 RepID=UPI002FD34427
MLSLSILYQSLKPDRPNQPKNPIAHFSQIRSPIHKKPDRPSTKNPIAGPQKPGFFRNTSVQPTDSGKNPVSWIIARR